MHLAIGAFIKDVSKSLWQISLTLTPRWNAVKLRFCPIFSTNLGIPFNRDLDCIKRQLFRGTSEHLASWRHTPFDTLLSLSILLEKQRQLLWLHIANCKGAFRLCNFVSNFLVAREKLLRKLQARAIFRTRGVWIFIAWIFIARNFIASVLDFHWGRVWHAL